MTTVVPMKSPRPSPSSGYAVKAADGRAEIWLYEPIGDGMFGGVSARMVRDDLAKVGRIKGIDLYINSPGGDVFEAVAIMSLIERRQVPVNVHIDGLAASAASVVAMVGDTRTIAESGFVMIHDPWGGKIGTAAELRAYADALEKVQGQLTGLYARKTGQSEADIAAMMAAETWLAADEAVALNFATAVSEPKRMAASADLSRWNYRNAPRIAASTTKPVPGSRPEYEKRQKALTLMRMRTRRAMSGVSPPTAHGKDTK